MKRILFAIALLALVQLACAANASLGEPTPQPTPAPPPTPQVIVIDRPVPTPASQDNGALIVIAVLLLAGTMMASGVAIGYIARGKPRQQQAALDPQSLTLTTNNYYGAPTPGVLTRDEQFRILVEMGHTPQQAMHILSIEAPSNARRIGAPK